VPEPLLNVAIGDGPPDPLSARPRSGLLTATPWRFALSADAVGPDASPVRARLTDLDVPLVAGSTLHYVVHADFGGNDADPAGGWGATAVAVDLVLDDGSRLSDHALPDHHGVVCEVLGQAASKTVVADQWTAKQVDLTALAGRRAVAAEVVVDPRASVKDDRPASGWVDGVEIVTAPPALIRSGLSPAERVLTTRGTHAGRRFSRGNNAPLTTVPHGAVFAIPVTDAGTNRWPYAWAEHDVAAGVPALQGFAVSHIASPWMADRSVVQLVPGAPEPVLDRVARARRFTHAREVARPHLYSVTFEDGGTAELTATSHALLLRLSLPEGGTVLADGVEDHGRLEWDVDDDGRGVLTGWTDGPDARGEKQLRMFVWGCTDTPVLEHGRFPGAERPGMACWARPDLAAGPDPGRVTVVLGTSFISVEQARRNVELEVGDDGFDVVVQRSQQAWDDLLGRVEVSGATEDQLTTLYSNLYRLFCYPNDAAEETGSTDQPRPAYASFLAPLVRPHSAERTGAVVVDGQVSVNHGFWDTYRTAWPLLALLVPSRAARLADGFVQHYRDSGWTARWSAPGYCDCMVGTSTDIVFADLLAAGVDDFDLWSALDSGLRNATVPATDPHVGRKGLSTGVFTGVTDTGTDEGLSWAMDNALNDYGIARMAALLLEREPTHERVGELAAHVAYFTGRAQAYAHHFDPATGFFAGVRPDGRFRYDADHFDPRRWGEDYTETNAWGMRFTVPHDGRGLASLFGGPAGLEAALDAFFAEPETGRAELKGGYDEVIHEMTEARNVRLGMLGLSNQPAHHIPFMYYFAGVPAKAHRVLRECVDRLFLGSELGQGYPGDEDNGEMSAWWVFAVLGLYPLTPGSGTYVIAAPRFDSMSLRLEDGAVLRVDAHRSTPEACHVTGVRIDGEPWSRTWVPVSRLRQGAVVDVDLSTEPGDWGRDAADAPPSVTSPDDGPRPWRDLTAGAALEGAGAALVDDRGERTVGVEEGWSVELPGDVLLGVELYTVTASAGEAPAGWRLEAHDGERWTVVDERRGETFRWERQTRPFLLPEPVRAGRYRFTALAAGRLGQLELLTR
jgi:predicted alpha-1,2-mannosidase